jgi:hypothetical protein
MTRIATTTQKKKTTIPGMACPAIVLELAMRSGYPAPADLFRYAGPNSRVAFPGD